MYMERQKVNHLWKIIEWEKSVYWIQDKVCIVKAMVFPLVTYECQRWTIKMAEQRRTDAFELWCWRKFWSVPWTARRSNQSILKEINPEYSLEGLVLKLKLQYFWPPDAKSWLVGKDPDVGKDWGQVENRVTEDEMVGWHHRLNGHEFEQTLNIVKNSEAWRAAVHGVAKSQTWRSNFTGSLVATEQHGPYFLGESDYRPHSKILWVQFSDHCKEQIL